MEQSPGDLGAARPSGRPSAPSRLHGTRRRCTHLRWLLVDICWSTRVNRAWWLIPVVGVALLAVVTAGAAQATVPYAVYTLF